MDWVWGRHPSVFNIFHLFFTCYLLAHSALPLFPVRPHPPDLWEPAFLVDKHLSLTGAKLACVPWTSAPPAPYPYAHVATAVASCKLLHGQLYLLRIFFVARLQLIKSWRCCCISLLFHVVNIL